MQTAISINQHVALKHNLSLQDAAVFAHFWALTPSDPKQYVYHEHRLWFRADPESVATALPLVKYQVGAIRKSIRSLVAAGLLERRRVENETVYAVGEAGRSW